MRKLLSIITLALCAIWIGAGMAARKSILSLLPDGIHNLADHKQNYEDFFFGIHIRTNKDDTSGSLVWLTDDENSELRRLLGNAYFGECLSSDSSFMEKGGINGGLYIVPRWVHTLCLTSLLSPFMHRIEMFYWPSKNLLYLSEDIEELSYDFSRGLNITNLPPRIWRTSSLRSTVRLGSTPGCSSASRTPRFAPYSSPAIPSPACSDA